MMCFVANAHRARLGIRRMSFESRIMKIEKAVQEAIAYGNPVVALESTIVAHGMPFPQNLDLAKEVEDILRGKVNFKNIAFGCQGRDNIIFLTIYCGTLILFRVLFQLQLQLEMEWLELV